MSKIYHDISNEQYNSNDIIVHLQRGNIVGGGDSLDVVEEILHRVGQLVLVASGTQ